MATKPSPAASRGQDADRGRDLKALEQRRLKAARLFAHGTCQAKVARALGVSPQTASRWHARWQQGGTRALRAPARQGRPPKLTPSSSASSNGPYSLARDQAYCECVDLRSERVAVRIRRRRCGMTPKQTGATVAFGRAVCRGVGVDLTHCLLA